MFNRMPIAILTAAVFTVWAGTAAYSADDSLTERAAGWWESVKEYSAEKADEVSKATSDLMDDMAVEIEELNASSAELADDSSDAANEELEELLKNAEEASDKLSNASGEAWEDAKGEFDAAYKALNEAVENRKEAVTREGKS